MAVANDVISLEDLAVFDLTTGFRSVTLGVSLRQTLDIRWRMTIPCEDLTRTLESPRP